MDNSVFVVCDQLYDGCVIHGIYTTLEKAEEKAEKLYQERHYRAEIEEYPLNEN